MVRTWYCKPPDWKHHSAERVPTRSWLRESSQATDDYVLVEYVDPIIP